MLLDCAGPASSAEDHMAETAFVIEMLPLEFTGSETSQTRSCVASKALA